MADLQQFSQFVRIGKQSDRTTVCPFAAPQYEDGSHANGWFDIVTAPDGLSGGTSFPQENVPTQHGVRGAAYTAPRDKNLEPGQLTLPLVPESLAFIFGLFDPTNEQLDYYTIEEYWSSSLTGGDIGRQLIGCIFDSWSIEWNRESSSTPQIQISFFLNQDKAIPTGSVPSFTRAPATPGLFDSIACYVDLIKQAATYSADLDAIRSVSLSYQNNAQVSDPRPNTTDSLNKAWTRHQLGDPTMNCSVRLRIDNDDYLAWPREDPKEAFKIRVGFFNAGGSYSASESSMTVAQQSSAQTLAVTDVTGLSDNDVVILTDGSKFTVGTVSSVTGVSDEFDLDHSDTSFSSEDIEIYNCAAEIEVPRMDLTQPGQKAANGQVEEVTHGFAATLEAGETALYTFTGYNDDNS